MKRLILLIALLFIGKLSFSQVQYTINMVAHGTLAASGQLNIGEFKSIKLFKAYVFRDAMSFDEGFDGIGDVYYKFTRTINTEDANKQRWNALDRYDVAVEITIKDYNSYTLIAIKDMSSNRVTVYKTL